MKSTKTFFILLFILLLGMFLRAYNLSGEDIWYDEGHTIMASRLTPLQIIIHLAAVDRNHPPFYFLLQHYWVNIFGDSVFSVRFLSFIFGTLALFVIYRLGELLFDKNTGLLSSLILSVSIMHIYFSQEARSYSLTALLALCSMYFFVMLLKKGGFGYSFWYVLSNVIFLYTHYSGFLILLVQNLYFFGVYPFLKSDYRLNFKNWISLQTLLVMLFLPWLWVLISSAVNVQRQGFWLHEPSVLSLVNSFIEYSGSRVLALLFLLLLISSIIIFGKRPWKIKASEEAGKTYLMWIWLVFPPVLLFIISKVSVSIYLTKYIIASSLPLYLLAAKGTANISYKPIKIVTICIIIAASLLSCKKYYTETNKAPWRKIAATISANAAPGDILLLNCLGCKSYIFDYYFKRDDVVKETFPEKAPFTPTFVDEENVKLILPMVKDYKRVWILYIHSADYKRLITKELITSYNLIYHNIYTANSYIIGDMQDVVELLLFEKK